MSLAKKKKCLLLRCYALHLPNSFPSGLMLLCLILQILQLWNEQGVAGAILEIGKKMLNLDTAPDSAGTMTTMQAVTAMATVNLGGLTVSRSTKKKPGPTKKPKIVGGKGGLGKLEKEVAAYNADAQNEELKALEAYILKLSQQGERHDTANSSLTTILELSSLFLLLLHESIHVDSSLKYI